MSDVFEVEYENETNEDEGIKHYSVGVYLEDLAYGGPEEGGWWYNVGELQKQFAGEFRLFTNEDEAYQYCRELNKKLEEHNEGRREISSVLSEGRYAAIVFDGFGLPEYFPERRPHYE